MLGSILPQRRGISSTIRCHGWSLSFCRRRRGVAAKPPQVTVSCPSGTRRWLSDRPRHPFGPLALGLVPYPALAGRGGSVSRRDHNKAYRRRTHLSGGTNSVEAHNSNASRSSGEGGLGGEELLSEKLPLPPESPRRHPVFSEGSAREGPFLKKRPLPRKTSRFRLQ